MGTETFKSYNDTYNIYQLKSFKPRMGTETLKCSPLIKSSSIKII